MNWTNYLRGVVLLLFLPATVSAISVADSLYQELKRAQPDTNKVILLNKLCWEYRTSNPAKAYEYSYAAIELAGKLHYDRGLANAWNRLGVVYYRQSNFVEATKALLTAIEYWDKLHDKRGKAKSLSNLGNVFSEQRNNDKALEYYLKAVELMRESGQQNELATFYINIGTIYVEQEKLGQARDFFIEALKISRRTGDLAQQAQLMNNLGATLGRMRRFDEAIDYHKQAIAINEKIPDKAELANCYLNLAVIYYETQKTAEAARCLATAEEFAREVDYKSGLRDIYKVFAKVYEANKQYETALLYQRKYSGLSDSLLSEENSIRVNELDARYQSAQKERELESKQLEIEKQQETERQNTWYLYIALGGIFLLLVLAGVIIAAFVQKQNSSFKLAIQKNEIEKKNIELRRKNKDILDSITYSKRIQDSMLPDDDLIRSLLPESFVFYKPRDIVSGDFFWMEKWGDTTLVAAADCTGHGVPGALMSMVGNNLLSQATNVYGLDRPGAVLQRVNKGVKATLRQRADSYQLFDGMDIALVAIRFEEMTAVFAGAHNPMWLVRRGQLQEFAATKQAIDGHVSEEKIFIDHEIALEKGDMIYLFTDGYADQFGGPNGKKFKYAPFKTLLCSIAHLPVADQQHQLRIMLETWQGGLEQVDDILVIGIRIT